MYELSSDSDDDCYDNLPLKLQKLKNKHALTNPLPSKDINESKSITNGVLNVSALSESRTDSDEIIVVGANDLTTSLSLIEAELPSTGVTTRSRRGKRKNSDVELSVLTPPKKGGKRGRGRGRGAQAETQAPESRGTGRRGRGSRNAAPHDSPILQSIIRGRGRGRGRRSTRQTLSEHQYTTYSVGNTDEYPDISENQLLFSSNSVKSITEAKVDDVTSIVDLDESLDNEELSVKVYWQHSEVFKFSIRRLQKLTQIFDFFIKKEGVSRERLLFTYNHNRSNKILNPDDTPESIDYNIAKFIEGGIVNKEFKLNSAASPQILKNGFVLKFQCQNRKKPYELGLKRDDKLKLAMVKCAEHLEIPIAQLVFEFDGETVQGNATPNDLDMESGDCIDVKIINVIK